MKILGIDTSTKFLILGFYDNGKVYEYTVELDRRLAVLLAPGIKRVLGALGVELKDIDYFACGLGPGSFTALRVGLATVKGLSWPLKKPVIGIPTLDILAKGVPKNIKHIIPAVDAKRGLIYSCIYEVHKDKLRKKTPYLLTTTEDLIKKIPDNAAICGDAVPLLKDRLLKLVKHITFMEYDYWYPKPHNIIALSLEMIKQGKVTDSFKLEPIYLYPKECQIKTQNSKVKS